MFATPKPRVVPAREPSPFMRRTDVAALLQLAHPASVTDLVRRGRIPKPHMKVANTPYWEKERFIAELKAMSGYRDQGGE